ncbi:hypothetical protein TCE0_056f18476 [Talaromyces pinophilus]|uniref:Uncharacterized protein n=1 Tax=Talaromyces pinophilus TaxID=128442 RepID=A0A0B8N5W9_TALPI|nr:hypothetical protein TCE0_056f18476 [Talaromyces pinophilus]
MPEIELSRTPDQRDRQQQTSDDDATDNRHALAFRRRRAGAAAWRETRRDARNNRWGCNRLPLVGLSAHVAGKCGHWDRDPVPSRLRSAVFCNVQHEACPPLHGGGRRGNRRTTYGHGGNLSRNDRTRRSDLPPMEASALQDIPFFHVGLAYCPHPSHPHSLRTRGSEASWD